MANQPGAAGTNDATTWYVREAATATSFGTPVAVSRPATPTEPTAVAPPGIGTAKASTEMPVLMRRIVHRLVGSPNAATQHHRVTPKNRALPIQPRNSCTTRTGVRATDAMAVQPSLRGL